MQQAGKVITDIFGNDLAPSESEATLEPNFAVLKLKHLLFHWHAQLQLQLKLQSSSRSP